MIAELPVSKMQELARPLKVTGIVVRLPDNPLESVTGVGAIPKQHRDKTSAIAGRITFQA
jgi:hypothetical protein